MFEIPVAVRKMKPVRSLVAKPFVRFGKIQRTLFALKSDQKQSAIEYSTQSFVLICVAVIVSFGFSPQAIAAEPKGNDPLSPSEVAQVQALAASAPRVVAALKAHGAKTSVRPGLANVQFLYSELRLQNSGVQAGERRADAYYYDYVTNEVIRQTVNITNNIVENVSVSSGLSKQPMATPIETESVFQILLAHPKFGQALKNIYAQHQNDPLMSAIQMRAQAGIFFPSSKIGTKLENLTQACNRHRCMQIFLHATDEALIDTNDVVVDLSTGAVIWR